MPPTKLQRWFDLIAFLAGRRRPVAFEQVMRGVPSYASRYAEDTTQARSAVRQMFERDKVELREAGLPIESVRSKSASGAEVVDGYRLSLRDFQLPYIRLLSGAEGDGNGNADGAADGGGAAPGDDARRTDAGDGPRTRNARRTRRSPHTSDFEIGAHDLAAALLGLDHVRRIPASPLATAASSAFCKLTFDLPISFPTLPPTIYLDPRGGAGRSASLAALSDAVQRRKTVEFRYHGIARDEATERVIEPYGLFFRTSRWYLVGRDRTRGAIRVFRVSRMETVTVNGRRARSLDFEVPEDFDLAAYATRLPWHLGSDDERPRQARVLFRYPRSAWAERNGYGELVETLEDGSAVRDFEFVDTEPFLRWLLPQGDDVVIQLPAELRADLRKLAARVVAAHERQD